jgi:hypothetical protein
MITVAGATYVYDEYVGLGWDKGVALAEKVGLGRALQILGAADMLPRARKFEYVTPSGTVYHVFYVKQNDVWYFAVIKDVEHWTIFGTYWESEIVIPPGEVPTNYHPIFASGPTTIWNDNPGSWLGRGNLPVD